MPELPDVAVFRERLRAAPRAAIAGALIALAACGSAAERADDGFRALPSGDAAAFDAYWYQGAEVDAYELTVERYGQPRRGQATAIHVTEPFRLGASVKADDPGRAPDDVVDVLKLNLVRDFRTGVYAYHTMTSVFVRADELRPLEVSFSSAEWCGHVFESLLAKDAGLHLHVDSYFEGESGEFVLERPPDSLLEDELPLWVRGLRGAPLRPGDSREVRLLRSAFGRRLTHRPPRWLAATISRAARVSSRRVPAGRFDVTAYTVSVEDGRVGTFEVEVAPPHRVIAWAWTDEAGAPFEGADAGALLGSRMGDYWRMNRNGDERELRELGLTTR